MFDQFIIVGTGELPFKIATFLFQEKQNFIILEYGMHGMSTLERKCRKKCFEYYCVNKSRLTSILENEMHNSLVISANNTYIFPNNIISMPNMSIINFHPALLPKHPGRNSEAWAIFEHDIISGITWHFVSDAIDQGRIICQKVIHISEDMTSLQLMMEQIRIAYEAFTEVYHKLEVEGIDNIDTKENKTNPKDIKLSTELPGNGVISWDETPQKIYDTLRAFDYGGLPLLPPLTVIKNGKKQQVVRYKARLKIDQKANCIYKVLDNKKIIEIECN